MSVTPLVTLASLKSYMGLAGTTVYDTQLGVLNAATSRKIITYCRRPFWMSAFCEEHDIQVKDQKVLRLKQYPIQAVAALTDYGSAITLSSDDLHIYYEEGIIRYDVGFTKGFKTLEATYTAGWDAIFEDLQDVVRREVSHAFSFHPGQSRGTGEDIVAEKIGDYSYRRDPQQSQEGFLTSSLPTLKRHRKIMI